MICQHYSLPAQECNDLVSHTILELWIGGALLVANPMPFFGSIANPMPYFVNFQDKLEGQLRLAVDFKGFLESQSVHMTILESWTRTRTHDLECSDLMQWYGAFALAMVLSLASAIPIVYICQLPKCGKRT